MSAGDSSRAAPSSRLELGRDVARRAVLAARQLELVAEHAQHAPTGPRVADEVGRGVEALPAAFGVDERAGRLGERADRQQHVGDVEQLVGNERREGDDGGAAQRRQRRGAFREILRRLDAEQDVGVARRLEHRARVEAVARDALAAGAAMRSRAGQRRTRGVGAFAQVAERRARDGCEAGRERAQLGVLRMALRDLAEQHERGLARERLRRRAMRSP